MSIAIRTSGMTIEIITVLVDNPLLESATGLFVYVAAEVADDMLGAVEVVAVFEIDDEVSEDRRLTCSVRDLGSVRMEVGTGAV